MPRLKSCIGSPGRSCGRWIAEEGPPRCSRCAARTPADIARAKRTRGNSWRAIKRKVLERDRSCKWPTGCATTEGLEPHHIVAIVDGGTDDLTNLVALCRRHHQLADDAANRRRRRSKEEA